MSDELKPGRELDALVAEKVMGVKDPQMFPNFGAAVPRYSTDIASAWLVVEKMRENIKDVLTLAGPSDETPKWWATFDKKWHGRASQNLFEWESGDTAPHAICLAALKAVGE